VDVELNVDANAADAITAHTGAVANVVIKSIVAVK